MMKLLKKLLLTSVFLGINMYAYDATHFVMKIHLDGIGSFIIPYNSSYDYNYSIDCNNDGTFEDEIDGSYTCNYPAGGDYTIVIEGDFPAIYSEDNGEANKILEVVQWGTEKWQSMEQAFNFAQDLNVTASDNPDLSQTSSMEDMFGYATNLTFTNSINDWNVSNVTNMSNMFEGTDSFNQDIGAWDVSNVTNMKGMFESADSFNQYIGNWDVSNVKDMGHIFAYASDFNQDIGDWNVSNVEDMENMFDFTYNFNQDIGDWNISNVKDMRSMFAYSSAFNQDIGDWDVSNVNDMAGMFFYASAFNQDIGDWDVSNVKDMDRMFGYASAFNQDIGDWDISAIANSANLTQMFEDAHLSVSNYDSLLIGWEILDLVDGVSFDTGTSNYCQGESARTSIVTDDTWTFSDSGKNCDFYINVSNKVSVKSGEKDVMHLTTNFGSQFAVSGGADGDKFTVDYDTQHLEFKDVPDVNNPSDKNGDNIYRVQVHSWDHNGAPYDDYQTIKVKVESDFVVSPALIMYLLN